MCVRALPVAAIGQATALKVPIFGNPNGHLNLQIQRRRPHELLGLRRMWSSYSAEPRIPSRYCLFPDEDPGFRAIRSGPKQCDTQAGPADREGAAHATSVAAQRS